MIGNLFFNQIDSHFSLKSDSCVVTNCTISLDDCPDDENDVGDLRVFKNGRVAQCLSPCKKWNFDMGRNEQSGVGLDYCCPTPPVSVGQCRSGRVLNTKYVDLVHTSCPKAYSYAYDDKGGLHHCSNPTSFIVNIC